jgi:hypothetical protein
LAYLFALHVIDVKYGIGYFLRQIINDLNNFTCAFICLFLIFNGQMELAMSLID